MTSQKPMPAGAWTTMLTPFDKRDQIDHQAVRDFTLWQIAHDVTGLFAVCLSSEMYYLDNTERLELARTVVEAADGRVPVVAGSTFGTNIEEKADFTLAMMDTGVEAAVVIAAQIAEKGEDETLWRNNLEAFLNRTGDIPLGLYECPNPYHRLVSAETLAWLARTGRFVFMKETSGSLPIIEAKIRGTQNTLMTFLNANGRTLLDSLKEGADGYCGIHANAFPGLIDWLCHNFRQEPDFAAQIQRFLSESTADLGDGYPATGKQLLKIAGLPFNTCCRRKEDELTKKQRGRLENMWKRAEGLRHHVGIC
ncbi:MAG: dihydrodipicolinate synthase family protein [Planctomycetes bacterium]|nr:dihydrodipicolinate synthase family protein [Planctomycetota bacterium]